MNWDDFDVGSFFEKMRPIVKTYAFDGFLIPILPIALKHGIKGFVQLEHDSGTIEELIFGHFCENSNNREIAQAKMDEFLAIL